MSILSSNVRSQAFARAYQRSRLSGDFAKETPSGLDDKNDALGHADQDVSTIFSTLNINAYVEPPNASGLIAPPSSPAPSFSTPLPFHFHYQSDSSDSENKPARRTIYRVRRDGVIRATVPVLKQNSSSIGPDRRGRASSRRSSPSTSRIYSTTPYTYPPIARRGSMSSDIEIPSLSVVNKAEIQRRADEFEREQEAREQMEELEEEMNKASISERHVYTEPPREAFILRRAVFTQQEVENSLYLSLAGMKI